MATADAAAGATAPPPALTADEATVYDRQLRVWGVEVQKKYVAGSQEGRSVDRGACQ
jgi:hypothetical protein